MSIWLRCPLVQDSQVSRWGAASKAASVLQACKGSALLPALVKSCLMQTGAKSAGQARSCLGVQHHLCMLAKNGPSLLQACWVHVRWDVELEPQPDTFDRKTEKCSGHVRPVDAHGRLASSLQAYRAVVAHPATLSVLATSKQQGRGRPPSLQHGAANDTSLAQGAAAYPARSTGEEEVVAVDVGAVPVGQLSLAPTVQAGSCCWLGLPRLVPCISMLVQTLYCCRAEGSGMG